MKRIWYVIVGLFIATNSWSSSASRGCPSSPNCVSSMVAPASLDSNTKDPKSAVLGGNELQSEEQRLGDDPKPKWFVEPIPLPEGGSVKALEVLISILEGMSFQEITTNKGMVAAVAESSLFGFKDDLLVVIDEANGLIHLRSASRTGYYDFGQNRKRIERIRQEFHSHFNE